MAQQKTDRLLRIAICALTVALVFAIYSGIHQRVVIAGESAPDFSHHNGKWAHCVSATISAARCLLLNFWASWCPPCVEETPSLSELAREFGPKGLVVLAVSVDDKPEAYRRLPAEFSSGFSHRARPEGSRRLWDVHLSGELHHRLRRPRAAQSRGRRGLDESADDAVHRLATTT